jgi:DNA-binding MarR family transcriptional regulator
VSRPRPRTEPAARRTSRDPSADERRPERRISLPFDVFAVASRLGAYLDDALSETGIRPAEYAVYSLMLEAGPRTPSELAAALGVPPTTISTYIATMLTRGDARRVPHPSDGRSHRVVLTDQGRGVIRRVNPAFARAEAAILANLDRSEAEIREALADLADALEQASRDAKLSEVTDTTRS